MSTLLNKNHPFRASVTHGDPASIGNSEKTTIPLESDTTSSKKESVLATLSLKSKVILYGSVGAIVTLGWIEIYDSIFPAPEKRLVASIETSSSFEDDWEYQSPKTQNVSQKRQKISWLSKTFCRGVQRASFCK